MIYEFGEFQMDAGEKKLRRRSGEVLQVPPKAFELLTFLVENEGRLLSKNELLDRVWADSFVEEGNLKITIHALRKVLDSTNAEFIETVPKHGYRFKAEVKTVTGDELIIEKITQSKIVIEQTESGKTSRWKETPWRYFLLLAIIVGGVAAIAFFAFLRPNTNAVSLANYKPNTLAVLPFTYIGDKTPDSEFMQASLSDALITRFGNLREIKVRPTSAIRRFVGQDFDSIRVGQELNVDAILEGTIRRDGEHVRVTAQLVRVSDQNILWTESFNEASASLIFLEDVIAARLATALTNQISPTEKNRLTSKGSENPTAQNLYQQGRFYWNKRTTEDLRKSITFFEKAIEQDQNYALAYAGLADAYLLLVEYWGILPTEGFAKARQAAQKSIELNDELAEPHTSLAYIQAFYDWDFPEAEKSFIRAISLNPNYSTARQWFGEFRLAQGRFPEALTQLKMAEELDPTSLILKADLAGYYYMRREYAKSIEISKSMINIDPNFFYAYLFLWIAYEQNKMPNEAAETLIKLYQVSGAEATSLAERTAAFRKGGLKELFQYEFKMSRDPKTAARYNDYQRAMQAMRIGDHDQTFAYLQKSFEARDRWFINLATDPQWDEIRSDPRFNALLEKIKM